MPRKYYVSECTMYQTAAILVRALGRWLMMFSGGALRLPYIPERGNSAVQFQFPSFLKDLEVNK